MPNASRTSASIHNQMGPAEEHTEHLDDTTVNFVTINEDSDLAPLLVGLPDDKCQCRHWGYLFSGQMTVTYADRVEEINPGDAFYMTPGHSPKALAGSEFVIFSPKEELAALEAHFAAVMQRMLGSETP
jgi:mannose-6-phosphate isomerase-like protein (cupin superfamily)